MSSKLDLSLHRKLSFRCTCANSDSIICSHSFTSESLTPSSANRFFSLSVEMEMVSGERERLSLNGLREKRLVVDAKASIQSALSRFELVLK